MQPRTQNPQKDMDLIILRSLKSIRKLWKEAKVSGFQIMQYYTVTFSKYFRGPSCT